jgi:hypothetical protein
MPNAQNVFGILLFCVFCASYALSQTPNATITGRVVDPSHAVIQAATVNAVNADTNISHKTVTNSEGQFTLTNLPPGTYKIELEKPGFRSIVRPDITLHVQDIVALNFTMPVGSALEIVTVEGGAPLINTQDATVSTVVDRNFAENLPMNGRSFQTLVQLTPGVVLTANNGVDTGQFSVNGQRATSNYWTLDGVSANTGISAFSTTGNGLGGAVASFSSLGGTNSLVSVDALQEFRIQTSTFAPEFGRTPGAQISIVTRSGTNQWHGSAFDYLRNDVLDASNWFNGFTNSPVLPKARERQNDFGGSFSGPIIKDRTFFFFSYEGLRLRLPQTLMTNVPDLAARQTAVAALQPYLNAYPKPNGADNVATGIARLNASFSNPATLDAYSLRLDHRLSGKVSVFGRYSYSPSEIDQRGFSGSALSVIFPAKITTQSGTAGAIWNVSSLFVNDFRFNYSRTDSISFTREDTFGGAAPLTSLPFPPGFSEANSNFNFAIFSLGFSGGQNLGLGQNAHNVQHQLNFVDTLSQQKGSHGLKFGVDFRRLSPIFGGVEYGQSVSFSNVSAAVAATSPFVSLRAGRNATLLFRNLGAFAQDTWRVTPRLTLTYGFRWDVDFSPSPSNGPGMTAVTGFNLYDLSNLSLAPAGTPPFGTTYDNFAPRVGMAYQLLRDPNWQTVVRGGFGVFYDLATAEAGNSLSPIYYPFGRLQSLSSATFPLAPGTDGVPAIVPPTLSNRQILFGFNPSLELPYTLQWNVALEQALGNKQTLAATYIGSDGHRLIQQGRVIRPNPSYFAVVLLDNTATSNYNALQIQFQRRVTHGLQALVSYNWSHSIDTASDGSIGNGSNALTPLSPNVNRGSSDFDIRHAFSLGLTYDVPAPRWNMFTNALSRGWSVENVFQARTAPPVDVFYTGYGKFSDGFFANVRPNVVSGQPLYVYRATFPGGLAFNPAAFTAPPIDATTGLPSNQGNFGRNTLRGFGAYQWDFAIHRDFPLRESLRLQFRGEMFNVLNHPNFGQPVGDLGLPTSVNSQFGQSIQMLGQYLSGGGVGSGAFSPLYQLGGPRSIQFALKLMF